MIAYDAGTWGVYGVIFRIQGSVFPKALCWAIPSACLSILLNIYVFTDGSSISETFEGMEKAWASYSSVLGFLIVFRNNQAYARFWEGVSLTQQVRGEWFIAISNIFAFCSRDVRMATDVKLFKQLMVRLVSLLHCTALQQVCELDDDTLEVISLDCIDPRKIKFLKAVDDPPELMITWIQRTIVLANDKLIIDIPPPILSRAFQELARGQVNLTNCQKLKRVPFPFPYAQVMTVMLLVHWVMTAVLTAYLISSWWCAGAICVFVTCAFWSLFYIAMEIDQPFGSDANDLPVEEIQRRFNQTLLMLLDPESADPPSLISDPTANTPMFAMRNSANKQQSKDAEHLTAFSSNPLDDDELAVPQNDFIRGLSPGARQLTMGNEYEWGVRGRCSIKSLEPIDLAALQQDSADRLADTFDVLGNKISFGPTSDTDSHDSSPGMGVFRTSSEISGPPRTAGKPRLKSIIFTSNGEQEAQAKKADPEEVTASPVFESAGTSTPRSCGGVHGGTVSGKSSCEGDLCAEKPHIPQSEQVTVLTSCQLMTSGVAASQPVRC